MRSFLLIILMCVPFISFGQGKVTRQKTNNSSSQSTSSTQNPKPSSYTKKRSTTPPIKIILATEIDGERKYFNTAEWKSLPIYEKVKYNKIGLVINSGVESFLFSLNPLPKWSNWEVAKARSGGQMPSKAQWQIIKQNKNRIQEAMTLFGGGYLHGRRWWNNGEKPSWTNMFYDGTENDKASPLKDEAGVWLATDNIEEGFQDVVLKKSSEENYDFIASPSEDSTVWRLVKYKEKFGFVDNSRVEIIPLKYDSIYCGGEYGRIWQRTDLMAVSKNGQWGYINKSGIEVVPVVYERVEAGDLSEDNYNKFDRVVKHGKMGLIDFKGQLIVPPIYDVLEDEESKDLIFFKDDNKFGYLDLNNTIVIPCIFEYTTGFVKDIDLAVVAKNGKYGFIDKSGDVKIALSYDFAGQFANGLAPVVKNNKVGFVNYNGNLVIPFEFDADYTSHYYDYKFKNLCRKELGLGYGFEYGKISFVKRNNKWGIIDISGNQICPYKYDSVISRSGYKSIVILDKIEVSINSDTGLELDK
ncbi:MAG: WG repeat-containing protein [Bacteroides sp.]|nr:WG repeat-containing protein [Bacteroides sp.]